MGQGLLDTPTAAGVARLQAEMTAARAQDHAVLLAVAQVEADGVAVASGYRSTKRFLEDVLRVNAAEAARLLDRAHQLAPRVAMSGQPLDPPLAATAAASAAGTLGEGHLTVITATMRHLDHVPGVDPDALADAEQVLVHYAALLAPAGLAKLAHRLIQQLDPDGAAPPEPPEPDDELHLLRRRDGSLALKGQVLGLADAEQIVEVFDALSTPAGPDDTRTPPQRFAEVLKELVAQAASPTGIATDTHHADTAADADEPVLTDADDDGDETEYGDEPEEDEPGFAGESDPDDRDDRDDRDDGTGGDAGGDAGGEAGGEAGDERAGAGDTSTRRTGVDLDQRAADAAAALHELPHTAATATRSVGCPTVTVSGRALLAVTIDHRWLQAHIGYGLLDSDRALDPATARRMACDAGVVPMVLGSRSEPLDVGRLSYTVPEGMRRALHVRDGGCSFPGCTRRPKRCHSHHVRHWIDGGETELDNLTLLCVHHHHLIHHGGWTVTMIDGRPWYRPPTWVDPQQRPRPGGRFPVPHTA